MQNKNEIKIFFLFVLLQSDSCELSFRPSGHFSEGCYLKELFENVSKRISIVFQLFFTDCEVLNKKALKTNTMKRKAVILVESLIAGTGREL